MRKHVHLSVIATSILIIITSAISEISLHLAAKIFPRVDAFLFPASFEWLISDSDLIYRGNPLAPDNDANGFRNANIPSKAEIVAIGDSHTYGWGVHSDEAWPHELQKFTSCRVYNMGSNGVGPLQYAILAERAMHFEPRVLLIGIYFGNDFVDNWDMYIQHRDNYPVPENLLQPAIELEQKAPLERDLAMAANFLHWGAETSGRGKNIAWYKHSAVWSFGQAIKNKLLNEQETGMPSVLSGDFNTAVASLTARQLEYASIFDGEGWRTILTSRYREAAENDDDPRIRVGYWLTEWAVQRINNLARQNGIRSIFVLLPTKESVFAAKVRDTAEHKYFEKLITEEAHYRQRLIHFMQNLNSSYVDLTPLLRTSAIQPYFDNANSHPNAVGHKIIAARLAEELHAPCYQDNVDVVRHK
jgi:hypothetical protein